MQFMLSAAPIEFTFDDDEWKSPSRLYRATSWGVTSIGRGFDWSHETSLSMLETQPQQAKEETNTDADDGHHRAVAHGRNHYSYFDKPTAITSTRSFFMPHSPSIDISPVACRPPTPHISLPSSPSSPRPRRRSSQQRVSLIAGRVSIAPIEPPSPPPMLSENLKRTPSSGSLLSTAVSTRAPSPSSDPQSFLGGRDISEFLIEGEIGRGAYGLVKRAREIQSDGSFGVCILFVHRCWAHCIMPLLSHLWLSNRSSNLVSSLTAGKSIHVMAPFLLKYMSCLPSPTNPTFYRLVAHGLLHGC